MREDWFWTAKTVFDGVEYMVDLDTVEEIAGIDGSSWATPTLEIIYKDGYSKTVPCHDDGPSDPLARPVLV